MDALVIGNGESRKDIDLYKFRGSHFLFGCNAIHRDIVVDHLICCDRRTLEEATNNPSTTQTKIYTREQWRDGFRFMNVHGLPPLPYNSQNKIDNSEHWGSGSYAVFVAAWLKFRNIKLIGFDLYSENNYVNNVYKDTENYADSTSQSVDHSLWVYHLSKVFEHYPNINFTIVNKDNWILPQEWLLPNINFISIDDL